LILFHETAVTNHVSGKNGGETALDAFFGHGDAIALEAPDERDCMGEPDRESITPHFRNGSEPVE
ncbi:MAG: hypothetical protein ACREEP_07355, partial [Dongiaceae bacterium]